MIKFKGLPVNVRCLFESASQNHVYVAQFYLCGGLSDNGRNLPVILDLLAKGFWISIIMWNLNLQSVQKL